MWQTEDQCVDLQMMDLTADDPNLLNLSPSLDSKGSMRSRDVSAFALVTSGDYGDQEARERCSVCRPQSTGGDEGGGRGAEVSCVDGGRDGREGEGGSIRRDMKASGSTSIEGGRSWDGR